MYVGHSEGEQVSVLEKDAGRNCNDASVIMRGSFVGSLAK